MQTVALRANRRYEIRAKRARYLVSIPCLLLKPPERFTGRIVVIALIVAQFVFFFWCHSHLGRRRDPVRLMVGIAIIDATILRLIVLNLVALLVFLVLIEP